MIDDDTLRSNLMTCNLYKKTGTCKYLVSEIENDGSKEKLDVSTRTIEHIMPRKREVPIWKKEIGPNYEEVYNRYLHTIGNLTITG